MRQWLVKNEGQSSMSDTRPESRRISAIRPTHKEAYGNRGIAKVKRVQVVEGVERVFIDEIPITTARIDSTRRLFAADRAPKPPSETQLVPAQSDEGRALGFVKDTICAVPRLDDPEYRKQVEEWAEKMMWHIVAEAVDVALVYVNTEDVELEAKTTEEKVTALKQAGYQQSHIVEIMQDVQRIAAFTEDERRRFFGIS
jgi:hypothetical protein